MAEYNFWVTVKQGRGIKNTSLFGSQTPYVVLECNGEKKHTKPVTTKTGEPEWNERMSFTSKSEPVSVDITLTVMNKKTFDSVEVGTCLASLPPYRVASTVSQWYTVSDKDVNQTGEVLLEVEWGAPPASLSGGGAGTGAGAAYSAGGSAYTASPYAATATVASAQPTMLDNKYTDLKLLGAGNFGRAYRARSIVDDAVYAVKLIKVKSAADMEQIKAEAKILLPLTHPHIVRYFNAFMHTDEAKESYYGVVMEYCNSGHLDKVIEDTRAARQQVNDGQIYLWIYQIASALAYLHSKNVLHRDLKGDNVFLSGGHAKLADFGLAQVGGAHGQAGAYAYESPEQARGLPYDGKNDVWALGCLLSELLTLKFIKERGRGAIALDAGIVAATIADAERVHPELGALCRSMMEMEPARRPSADQIVQQLQPRLAEFEARSRGAPAPAAAAPAAPTAAAEAPFDPAKWIRLTCNQCGQQIDTELEKQVVLCPHCRTAIGHAPCSACFSPMCFLKDTNVVHCPKCTAATDVSAIK